MFLGDESGYQADRSLYTLGVMIDIQTYNQRGNYEYRFNCGKCKKCIEEKNKI